MTQDFETRKKMVDEDKKEIELVRVPLKGSTRDRKDRGVL